MAGQGIDQMLNRIDSGYNINTSIVIVVVVGTLVGTRSRLYT